MRIKQEAIVVESFAIGTSVRIVAVGCEAPSRLLNCVGFTGATDLSKGTSKTAVKLIDPDTGIVGRIQIRTEWLEPISSEEELIKAEELKCALAHSRSVVSLVESEDSAAKRSPSLELVTSSASPNSLNNQNTAKANSEKVIPISQSTTISEPSTQIDTGMSVSGDFLAPAQAALEIVPDLQTPGQDSGEKCTELSPKSNPDSSSSKTPKPLDIEGLQQSSVTLTPSGTWANGQILQQVKSASHTIAAEFFLLPTPMGYGSLNSRPAGQTKLEQTLRKSESLAPDQSLNPAAVGSMMGFMPQLHGESPSAKQDTLKLVELTAGVVAHELPPSPGSELTNSIVLSDDELSYDEERDRHHLEKKVDNAMYDGWSALAELKQRRLYRNTHSSWEDYCKQRFGYGRDSADLKILAAVVVDNLKELPTIGRQILPTSERQVRPLTKLEPDEQRQVWTEAIEKADGKIPSGAIVKSIVQRIKERSIPPLTDNPQYQVNDVVRIKASGNPTLRSYDGYWGVVERVSDLFYHVWISLKEEPIGLKGYEVERLDLEHKYQTELRSVSDRISRLVKLDLEPIDYSMLENLQRSTCFTPHQLKLLQILEGLYGIKQ